MMHKDALTKTLAIVGTVLAWFPILAPILLSGAFMIRTGLFRLDYLMPAELFLVALTGGLLLLWAAWRAHSRRSLIAGGLGAAIALLVGGQALAVMTGLASGETEPAGIWWILVLCSLALFTLALIFVGVGGALLIRDLFRSPRFPVAGGA